MPFDPSPPPAQLRILRIIVSSLVIGICAMAIVAIVAPVAASTPPATLAVLRGICVLVLVGGGLGALLLRHAMLAQAARESAADTRDERLAMQFYTSTLISCAIVEGAGLLAIVIYMLSRNPLDLFIAGVAVLLILGVFFPTEGRWRRFTGFAREDRFGPPRS